MLENLPLNGNGKRMVVTFSRWWHVSWRAATFLVPTSIRSMPSPFQTSIYSSHPSFRHLSVHDRSQIGQPSIPSSCFEAGEPTAWPVEQQDRHCPHQIQKRKAPSVPDRRSEEHTSELQSRFGI